MKFSELQQKPMSEIKKLLNEKQEQLRKFRFDLISGKVKNVREIRQTKKDIAQIFTILNKKQKK